MFDGPCIAAHCLAVSDDDLEILAQYKVTVAHTPITYMKLAMGVNDLSRFLARGILVAPGSFYGVSGREHVRIALTATDERIEAAACRLEGG